MTPSKLVTVLKDAITHSEQLLIVGAPGIGKTDIVEQAAQDIGCDILKSHPAIDDPTDYKGLPFRADNSHAEFLPFGNLWTAMQAKKPLVYFIDDLGQAAESVQKALMQLLLGRKLNGHQLPDCVTFVAATNDVKQQSGVSGMIEPVKSRFDSIVHLEVSLDDWCDWALRNDQPAELIAFLRNRPELLHAFTPTKELVNSPCPRTWASIGRRLARGVNDFDLYAGAVGKGPAREFTAFLELITEAPSVDAILADPDGQPVPEKPALRYLVATALGQRAEKQNIERAFRYLQRMQQQFRVLAMRDAIRRDKMLANTKTFVAWVSSAEGKQIF
jgi:hypothetical protein